MGIDTNSHGKRSDKETQSPLLKIFKEIMMREEHDPEKRNLLLDQEKKRKQYSGSRTKVNRRSCESSSSEHRKRSPYKTLSPEQKQNETQRKAEQAFRGEKKDHWWKKISSISCACDNKTSCQDAQQVAAKNDDDTCSCVSCALKRIVGSEFACIACLLLLFSISIVAACCLVYKNVPSATATSHKKPTGETSMEKNYLSSELGDSERLKRKIDSVNDSLMKNELRDEEVFGKPQYDHINSEALDMPGISEIDFGPGFSRGKISKADSKHGSGDLASVLDQVAINDQGSDKLKEFYKKLVKTDTMIKNLKNIKLHSQNDFNSNYQSLPPDRFRRSLKVFHYPKKRLTRRRRREIYSRVNNFDSNPASNKSRSKRFGNGTRDPTAFVIEKKKLIVQYRPSETRKLVPKCSHAPKEQQHTHHEHHLKHPFYQNTQRLDELLDRFLNKNLPDLVDDPFGFDSLFQSEKNKCKHPTPTKNVKVVNIDLKGDEMRGKNRNVLKNRLENPLLSSTLDYKHRFNAPVAPQKNRLEIAEEKNMDKSTLAPEKLGKKSFRKFSTPEISKLLGRETAAPEEKKFYRHEAEMINKEGVTLLTASPSDFELLLSVSTLMNPEVENSRDTPTSSTTENALMQKVPNIRRLLQMDGEEEENLGYEDFKEVLTDNMENQDDNEGRGERRKRDDEEEDEVTEIAFTDLGITLIEPVEEKDTRSDNTITGEWVGSVEDTTPLSLIKDMDQKKNKPNLPENNVNNPNWKGPMPLYPDELSSMLKEKTMDLNKMNMMNPDNHGEKPKPPMERIRKRSEIDYVEDYLDDKYDRLVEMAQAYSDYGVLEGKKENIRNEKHPATSNKISGDTVKLSADLMYGSREMESIDKANQDLFYPFCIQCKEKSSTPSPSNGIFRLLDDPISKKPTPTLEAEGFRVEVRPSMKKESLVSKLLQSHIKLDEPVQKPVQSQINNDPVSTFPKTQLMYEPQPKLNSIEEVLKNKIPPPDDFSETPNNYFSAKKKRSLLSTFFKESNYDNVKDKREILDDNFRNVDQHIDGGNVVENAMITSKRTEETANANSFRKMFKEKNRFLKDIVSKYMRNASYDNQEEDTEHYGNMGGTTHTENEDLADYVSKLTDSYVKLFSVPNYYTQTETPTQQTTTTADANAAQSNMEQVSNITSFGQLFHKPTQVTMNSTDLSELFVDLRNKPVATTTNFPEQMFIYIRNPNVEHYDSKLELDLPFLVNYSDLTYDHKPLKDEMVSPRSFHELSTDLVDIFQVVKRIGRFKRHVGTAKTILEKSNVTINESPFGLADATKRISSNDTKETVNSSFTNNAPIVHSNSTNNITLSDFFMMVSNWFKALEGIQVNENKTKLHAGCDLPELLLALNKKSNKSKNKNKTSTTDSVYPLYDSELVDNIGHRSRVLLSITEEITTESERRIAIDSKEVKGDKANATGTDHSTSPFTNDINVTLSVSVNNATQHNNTATTTDLPKKHSNSSNKVKRNADDSNLISWNDIYDDEYGIRTDNFNNVRDKYSKERDFIKRSGRWVQDKIKKITDNLKGHPEKVVKRRTTGANENVGIVQKLKDIYRKTKRQSDEDDYEFNQKAVFNKLENNMIAVCRKAADAVKRTRNAEVKEQTPQNTVAASLMQQLVRLLTDLVDYQVEQKTRCQLPSDLKVFLEWLTKPEEEFKQQELAAGLFKEKSNSYAGKTTQIYSKTDTMDNFMKDKSMEYGSTTEFIPSSEETDLRTMYMQTLQSIQELLDEYEEMSDEEKSKMTGVKLYLQNQLRNLNTQFGDFNMYQLYDKSNTPIRYKRGLRPRSIKSRRKRKHYKFVRNFGKKHTRTTASYYDGIPIAEKKKNNKKEIAIERKRNKKRSKSTKRNRKERNLKDVYYKAVAEAKKYSTSLTKNAHSKHQESDYTVTTHIGK